MRRDLTLVSLALSIAMMGWVGGCAKKEMMKEESMAEAQEERVTSPPQTEEKMAKAEKPEMKESDIGASREMPMKEKTPSMKSAGVDPIYFDFDRFNIREDMRSVLESNAKWLKARPDLRIKIEGHADERGTGEYNLALGQRRANATKQFLVALGIQPSRMTIISYGEERPVCKASTEDCFSQNRRAHFDLQGQ